MQSILNTITVFSVSVSIYFAFLFTLYCNPNAKLCISVTEHFKKVLLSQVQRRDFIRAKHEQGG